LKLPKKIMQNAKMYFAFFAPPLPGVGAGAPGGSAREPAARERPGRGPRGWGRRSCGGGDPRRGGVHVDTGRENTSVDAGSPSLTGMAASRMDGGIVDA